MTQKSLEICADFENIGKQIGKLLVEKNKAYGSSFSKCGEFLKLLYPDGITPDSYTDVLLLVRMFDKFMRIANDKSAFNESPYQDLAGYAILGIAKEEK